MELSVKGAIRRLGANRVLDGLEQARDCAFRRGDVSPNTLAKLWLDSIVQGGTGSRSAVELLKAALQHGELGADSEFARTFNELITDADQVAAEHPLPPALRNSCVVLRLPWGFGHIDFRWRCAAATDWAQPIRCVSVRPPTSVNR